MLTSNRTLMAIAVLAIAFVAHAAYADLIVKPRRPHVTKIGDFSLALLNDSTSENDIAQRNVMIDAPAAVLKKFLPTGKYPNAVNAFLLQANGKKILFDSGLSFEKLLDNLAEQRVRPDEIDLIMLTHMHGDHIGGLVAKDGTAVFPKAEMFVAAPERNYWTSDAKMKAAANAGNFELARKVLAAYEGRVRVFNGKTEIVPGITTIKAYGHTPGHTGYLIESKGESLLVWGDLTHVTPVQFPHPEIAVTYDIAPKEAVASREAIMKMAAEQKITIAGMHIPGPGVGRVQKAPAGEGKYRFAPMGDK